VSPEVLTVLSTKIMVFCIVTLCSSVDRYSDLLYCHRNDTEQDFVTTKIFNCCFVTTVSHAMQLNTWQKKKLYTLFKCMNVHGVRKLIFPISQYEYLCMFVYWMMEMCWDIPTLGPIWNLCRSCGSLTVHDYLCFHHYMYKKWVGTCLR
jgi:hypothetical protein